VTPQNRTDHKDIEPKAVRSSALGSSGSSIQEAEKIPEEQFDENTLIEAFVAYWNERAPDIGLSQIASFNRTRKYALHAVFKDFEEHGPERLEFWEGVFEKIFASTYLLSLNGVKKWLTIDWVLKPENLAKILEGKFDDSPDNTDDGPFDLSGVPFFNDGNLDGGSRSECRSVYRSADAGEPEEPPPELPEGFDFDAGGDDDGYFPYGEEVLSYAGSG
jgi:hypothetical protein